MAAVTWRPVTATAAELVSIRTSSDSSAASEAHAVSGNVAGLADARASDDRERE